LHQAQKVEPSASAEAGWLATLRANALQTAAFQMECTPGYYNGEGRPGEGGLLDGLYGPGSVAFFELARAWRNEGNMAGLEFG